MAKALSKPQKSATPAAPAWMNTAQKRDFSALLALEIGWKSYATDIDRQRFGDLVDLRGRISGMRKLMRTALRSKDVATVLSLNSALNATTAQAQRLEETLQLQHRQTTAAESARRAA